MRGADVESWLRNARDDLIWAHVSLDAGLFSRSCFACQQAVEKILKAYLIKNSGNYPRTHNLLELLALAKESDIWFEDLKSTCDVLDEYYIPVRYPSFRLPEDFGRPEAQSAVDLASQLVEAVERKIGQP